MSGRPRHASSIPGTWSTGVAARKAAAKRAPAKRARGRLAPGKQMRGPLAAEIALSSAAQVAVFLVPAVVLLSLLIEPLALSFRPIELVAIGVGAVLPALVLRTGRTTRLGGVVLLFAYSLLVVCFYLAGDR